MKLFPGTVMALLMLTASAAAADTTRYVTQAIQVQGGVAPTLVKLYCPPNFFPVGTRISNDDPNAIFRLIDTFDNGLPLLPSPNALLGAGWEISLFNAPGRPPYIAVVTIYCVEDPPVPITTVLMQGSVPPNGSATVTANCPGGQVPLGVAYKSGSTRPGALQFLLGTPQNPVLLDVAPDGLNGPPFGMQAEIVNQTATAQQFSAPMICAALSGTQTLVASVPTPPGRSWEAGVVVPSEPLPGLGGFAPATYGFGFAPGATSTGDRVGLWGTDGSFSTQQEFLPPQAGPKTSVLRGVFFSGRDTRSPASHAKATSRAVMGLLLAPSTTPTQGPVTTTVVEFHHQMLDHYFITAIPKEISDLDSGVHKGWTRTGKSFKAYATGSSGKTTRRPVCREYGNPAVGLDSHFYSASPAECFAALANFNGAWLLESSEVFQMDLPDTTTGACPSGGVPIYRLWNNRVDSNHRYTTTIADRDAMVGRGFIAEGYGPNSVTLCALP